MTAFMVLWVAMATVAGLFITITSLTDPKSWYPGPPPLFFGLIFPVFGIGLLAVGRLIARVQEKTILKRLDELLGTKPS